jgi:hypothetical protein
MGLHPARSSSAAAPGLPSAADVPAARALSSATSAGALFQSPAGLPSAAGVPATRALSSSSAAARRLQLPTGAL